MSGGGISWHGPGPGGLPPSRVPAFFGSPRRRKSMTKTYHRGGLHASNHSTWKILQQTLWATRSLCPVLRLNVEIYRTSIWVLVLTLLLCPSPGWGPALAEAACQCIVWPSPGCQCTEIGNTGNCRVNCSSSSQNLASLTQAVSPKFVGEL